MGAPAMMKVSPVMNLVKSAVKPCAKPFAEIRSTYVGRDAKTFLRRRKLMMDSRAANGTAYGSLM